MQSARPNVVIILADDMGPLTIAPTSPLSLPHLHGLYQDSRVFANARSPAFLCAPGRYALMTGNLPLRSRTGFGQWAWPAPSALKPDQRSIAQLLREGGGYHTQFAGKWHLGGDPIETGFDGALFVPRGHSFTPYTTLVRGKGIKRPDECSEQEDNTSWRAALPNCLAAHARNVLLSAPTPFFYYHSASQMHGPYSPGAGLHQLGMVANESGYGPRFDAVVSFDLSVGAILRALDTRGVSPSTFVVLMSDHGQDCDWEHVLAKVATCPQAQATGQEKSFNFFKGMRGYKGKPFEGGLRVPLWLRWPGIIQPGVSTATTATIDYVRTLLHMIRVDVPHLQAIDSTNLSDEWLANSPPTQSLRNVFVANGSPAVAIRIGDHKAIFRRQYRACPWNTTAPFYAHCFNSLGLYDLSRDPLEITNLLHSSAIEMRCMRDGLLRIINSASPPTVLPLCTR